MPARPHERIIKKIARETLKPLGVKQRGQSRFWYEDHGWFASFAEFQPYSGERGSCLNTGVTFLLYPKDSWSFDISERSHPFAYHKTDAQFSDEMQGIATVAKHEFIKFREIGKEAKNLLPFFPEDIADPWKQFNRGMLLVLANKLEEAVFYLDRVINGEVKLDWEQDRKTYAETVRGLLKSSNSLEAFLNEQIAKRRTNLRIAGDFKLDLMS